MLNLFDNYSLKARLYPAFLTTLPAIVIFIAWFPKIESFKILGAIVTAAGAIGLLYLLASISRTKGRKIEERYLKQWGGWPSTVWLRHSDTNLNRFTKARYHNFLTGKNNWTEFAR